MRPNISSDFRFIAWNPPTIFIAGGIFCVILAAILKALNIFNSPNVNAASAILVIFGFVCIIVGIILYGMERGWN